MAKKTQNKTKIRHQNLKSFASSPTFTFCDPLLRTWFPSVLLSLQSVQTQHSPPAPGRRGPPAASAPSTAGPVLKAFAIRSPVQGGPQGQRVKVIICLSSEHAVVTGPYKARLLVYFHFFYCSTGPHIPSPGILPSKGRTEWFSVLLMHQYGLGRQNWHPSPSSFPTQDFVKSAHSRGVSGVSF